MKSKPNFFIVGTPKAGTTSLYYYLESHPEVYMSPIKETNFFSYEEIKKQNLFYNEEHIKNLEQYSLQFEGVKDEKAIGEASVSYLFYPSVPAKIKEFNTDARIIIVLRNPIDRGYSHYLMDKRLGLVNLSYEDILNNNSNNPRLHLFYQQYICLGLYYEQVKRYLDTFGQDAVKIILYEDLISRIDETMADIYSFIGVDDSFKADTSKQHNAFSYPKNWLVAKLYTSKTIRKVVKNFAGNNLNNIKNIFFGKDKKPELSAAVNDKLKQLYGADLVKTQDLLQKDLSNWM